MEQGIYPGAAMVVLSGGQDSTTCLYWARQMFRGGVHAITFDYGQRHRREIAAAEKVGKMAGVLSHTLITLGPILDGTSPLTNKGEQLETYRNADEMAEIIGDRVEKTFVPMRNAVFLTIAANHAVCRGSMHLVTGVCQEDNANYPDCRQVFVATTARMIEVALGLDKSATEHFRIHAPLMHLSKADTVRLATTLPGCMDAMAYTHTAYSGEYPPLTQDHATVLRAKGFLDAGVADPLIVRAWIEGLMELPSTPNYDSVRGDR